MYHTYNSYQAPITTGKAYPDHNSFKSCYVAKIKNTATASN